MISLNFGEFDANSIVTSLENSDAHFCFLFLVTLVLSFQGKLGFIFFIVDDRLNIFFLSQMLVEGLLDHIWIIG